MSFRLITYPLEDLKPFPSLNPSSSPSSRKFEQLKIVPNLEEIMVEFRADAEEIAAKPMEKALEMEP